MTHSTDYWATKLPEDRRYMFWLLIDWGFSGESAYQRTISRTYG